MILTGTILVLFLLPYLYGIGEIPEEELKGELKVALIQPNIGPEEKWGRGGTRFSFDTLSRMTVKASYEKPDLVIWPETAAPCYIRLKPKYRRIVHSLSDSLGTPILTGAPDYVPETGESYNSAFLFTPGERKLQGYSKINLVPVSERVPYRDVLPLLGKIKWDMLEDTDWGQANFSRGKEFSIFQHPKGRFATLICFESIFPDLVREFVRREADFLVNITNDAWFGRTSSPYQHARIAVFRAVENRIAIARCASTGVSMFIDPYGRVSQATGIFHPAIVLGSIPLRKEDTFFTKYGNVFSNGTVAVSLGLILMAVVSGLRRKVEN